MFLLFPSSIIFMNMCFFTTYCFLDCFSVLSFSFANDNFFRDNRFFRHFHSLFFNRNTNCFIILERTATFLEYVVFCMYIFIVIHMAAFNKSFFTLDRNIYYLVFFCPPLSGFLFSQTFFTKA